MIAMPAVVLVSCMADPFGWCHRVIDPAFPQACSAQASAAWADRRNVDNFALVTRLWTTGVR
ncbi:hypothetical protein, partial [Haloactinopolyspora sp.]|uniref:hypothetical protein n=1 Tax=Haloactinopolyspora sp. TaxID=1966353 RepID=UPI0026127BBF